MIKKPITINLSTGLEARPVAQLVQVASQFNSEIYVEIGKKRVNAKSIMGMMTLGLDAGEEITLSANGEDEEAAMAGAKIHSRLPTAMEFWLVCLGILAYSCQNTSRDSGM